MKKLLLLFIAFAVISCADKKENSPNQSAENIKIVEKMFTAFNEHKWDEMAALYSDTAEFKDPSLGTSAVLQSRQNISEKYAGLQAMFPNVHDEILNIYPSGDKHVIVEFISTGTGEDSVNFSLPICTIFTIENGLITKDYTYYNE